MARPKLTLWFNQVERWNCKEFNTVIKTFQNHYDRILNFFNDKRTNASSELAFVRCLGEGDSNYN
ncbi:MAG: transposase [Prevotella sp.]|nr:transposase [Prevotella sp.]